MEGIYAAVAGAFASMAPVAVFIGLCERAVGLLVKAVSGRGGLL